MVHRSLSLVFLFLSFLTGCADLAVTQEPECEVISMTISLQDPSDESYVRVSRDLYMKWLATLEDETKATLEAQWFDQKLEYYKATNSLGEYFETSPYTDNQFKFTVACERWAQPVSAPAYSAPVYSAPSYNGPAYGTPSYPAAYSPYTTPSPGFGGYRQPSDVSAPGIR